VTARSTIQRWGALALWLIPLALVLLSTVLLESRPAAWLDGQISDMYFELRGPREASGEFVIVGIDDASYDELSLGKFHWGWYHAEVIRRLAQAGAKAIALDLFAPPVAGGTVLGMEQEHTLKELERESFLAMGAALAEATYADDCPVFLACLASDGQVLLPRSELLDAVGGGHDHLGIVNLPVGKAADSVVREFVQVLPETGATGRGMPSLPYLAAYYARSGALPLASGDALPTSAAYINYVGPAGSFTMIPFRDVLLGAEETLTERVAGKVVFIGDWGQPQEMFATPYSGRYGERSMSGVEILANAADTFYLGYDLMPPALWMLLLATALLLALSTMAIQLAATPKSLPLDIVLAAAVAGSGYALFTSNMLAPVGTLLILLVANSAIVRALKLLIVERELRHVRAYFRRSMGPKALSRVPSSRLHALLKGQQYEVAVLVAKANEAAPGQGESSLEHFKRCKEAIAAAARDSDGWLYQSTAQASVVLFGCPIERPDTVNAALSCARLMQAALESQDEPGSQEALSSQETAPLSIGLHHGQVTVGSTRLGGMLDFIAHGHPVNVAHQLAELGVERGKDIFASGEFVNKLSGTRADDVRQLEGGLVVGKTEISLYTFTERKPAIINP
jgi:CHASE2 domain-containing sensor protein/class 3 adenylate cyclase